MHYYNIRPTTPTDLHLPWFDFTVMTAIITCPRWGLIRYIKNLTTGEADAREMPLEAGKALHDSFAADRLYHLIRVQSPEYHDLVLDRGIAVFGKERWLHLSSYLSKETSQPIALEALYSSGFYDDGSDKKRTLSNLEQVIILYLQQRDFMTQPVYIDLEKGFVGVEILVDFVVQFINDDDIVEDELRYLGRADGIHTSGGRPIVHENKSTTIKAKEWAAQWHTSHQPTGYMLAVSLMTGLPCTEGLILGSKLPLSRNELDDFIPVSVVRHDRQFTEFFRWLHHGFNIYKQYVDDPWSAPMFTHSCYRYFQVCQFLPICQGDKDDFVEYIDLLNPVQKPWHPHS